MSNWKEQLDKDLHSKDGIVHSRQVEIQALLERFQVRRKLTEIRDQIWKMGKIEDLYAKNVSHPVGFGLRYTYEYQVRQYRHDYRGDSSMRPADPEYDTRYETTGLVVDLTDQPESSFKLTPQGSSGYLFWEYQPLGVGKLLLRITDDIPLRDKKYVLLDPNSPESEKEFDDILRISNLQRFQFNKLPEMIAAKKR